jgi:hypothetical protein
MKKSNWKKEAIDEFNITMELCEKIGHIRIKDVIHLESLGIPLTSICIKNIPIENIKKGFNVWLENEKD